MEFFSLFPALRNRNYQLYFSGQLISLIGTWLQMVAQAWLVLKLTNSAFLMGLVVAVGTAPTLLFSLFGGVIVDRFPKRKILIFTQISSMILAFILGFLTIFNLINVWEIALLAFLLGTVNALDTPARQSFTVEVVGKEDLHSAIALNSGMFNSARVIGPSIAGFLIAIFGTGGAFILNGLSYLAVITALILMNVKSIIHHDIHPNPLKAIKEGVSYTITHPIIRGLLIFTGMMSIFGWSFMTIMPFIAKNTYQTDATGLGHLYAAMGIGALLATFLVSAFAKRIKSTTFIFGGNLLFIVTLVGFTFTSSLIAALPFLFLSGMGLLLQFSIINSTIQHLVEDRYRGRVMALYSLMFMGLMPLGSLQIGFFSEHFGTSFALRLCAVVILLFNLVIFLHKERIADSYQEYKEKNRDPQVL